MTSLVDPSIQHTRSITRNFPFPQQVCCLSRNYGIFPMRKQHQRSLRQNSYLGEPACSRC
jgi:hypothetical protein